MFKILIRGAFVLTVGLSAAAVVTMTANRSDAQGVQVPKGSLRPIQPPVGGGSSPMPAFPQYIPNPNGVRTPLTPVPTPPGVPPVDPTGINQITIDRLRPTLRPGNFAALQAQGSGQQGQQGQQGIQGQQGGIQGQQGGIQGQQGGIQGGQQGIAGGVGGGILGGGLQSQYNFQGGVIFPGAGFGAIGIIQVPTVGFPSQQQVQGGFGGGINGGQQLGQQGGIQGQIGGIGGIGGQQGGIGGIGGIGGQQGGGKRGFGGYYGL